MLRGIAIAMVAVKSAFMLNSPEPASTTNPLVKNIFRTLRMICPLHFLFWPHDRYVTSFVELDFSTPYGRAKLGKGVR